MANALSTSRPEAEKGEPFRADMQAVNFRIVSNHALISNNSEARVIDVVLRLLRFRVVWRGGKPAHDHVAEFDGVQVKRTCSINF